MKTVSTHEDDGVPRIAAGLNAESQVVLQPPSRATQRLLEAVQDRSCVEGVQAGHLAPWAEPNQPEPAPEILARSNSAWAASMWSCNFPAGVVQSMPSPRLTKAMPRSFQVLDESDQVTEVPSESIQPPTHHDIEPLPLGLCDELVECGSTVLRA